ncbi:MAG: hypothetical protein NT062_20370, partial [Proteobacteria bacterium]|nr:hypothetical protein [Pseudomonadota bacterium]
LVSLAGLTSLAPNPAEACGGYVPQLHVFRVVTHDTRAGARAFVITGRDARTDVAFRMLEPQSYDATSVAELPALTSPWQLTLIGEHGTAQVETSKAVLLTHDWTTDGQQVAAVELPQADEPFALAVAGVHTGLAWAPARDGRDASIVDRAWLAATKQPLAHRSYVRHDLPEVGYVAFTAYDDATHADVTVFRDEKGHVALARPGRPRGVVSADGDQYVVIDVAGVASAIKVTGSLM